MRSRAMNKHAVPAHAHQTFSVVKSARAMVRKTMPANIDFVLFIFLDFEVIVCVAVSV